MPCDKINVTSLIGCLNDLRYNDKWFPMRQGENDDSEAAELLEEQDTAEGCADPAICGSPAEPACPDPLVCRDVWRLAICQYVHTLHT